MVVLWVHLYLWSVCSHVLVCQGWGGPWGLPSLQVCINFCFKCKTVEPQDFIATLQAIFDPQIENILTLLGLIFARINFRED